MGEMYAQAVEETGLDSGTLRDAKWVASKVDLCRRRHKLSFSHHKEVAALSPDLADTLLDKAEQENLTRRELRQEVTSKIELAK